MRGRRTLIGLLVGLLLQGCLAAALLRPFPAAAEESPCAQVAAQLEDHNQRLSEELRRLHRELAALRADLDKPGLSQVFGGLGYILGLFGVAAFVAARRKGG